MNNSAKSLVVNRSLCVRVRFPFAVVKVMETEISQETITRRMNGQLQYLKIPSEQWCQDEVLKLEIHHYLITRSH